MPLRKDIKKVLVIGSGPIVIGQAAEFDYAGTQACRALKDEGLEVVLVNSNPATIMTDANMADKVYLEPLTPEFVTKVIRQEKPQGLLATLGGQVGLNMAVELSKMGVLEEENVILLGTPLEAIKKAEDRELFKEMMELIGEPIPESAIVSSIEEAVDFSKTIGYPLIVRPAYTLGGTGGGIAYNQSELEEITGRGLKYSMINQALIERSVAGWKEIEYEVMRDGSDNCITICNMENIDPIGVHTGDSIVVAPTQTLSDKEHQMMRSASLKIIRALKINGGCNVQFAFEPVTQKYYVIEVNPRVSRSSALASKATGYPIAKVTAKIALGYSLDEIQNAVTGKTCACFEPTIDYVVLKYPRWPFDKFTQADRTLGTQMKATGEVMSIDRSFEAALLKSIRSLEAGLKGLYLPDSDKINDQELADLISHPDDRRLLAVAEGMRRGLKISQLYDMTKIEPFFLEKIKNIVDFEGEFAKASLDGLANISFELMQRAKKLGFSDQILAYLAKVEETQIRTLRENMKISAVYKMVDTCAAEFDALTPYYYSCYDQENEAIYSEDRKIVVLGSGPIRIGQGIEFDYCSVHSVWALRQQGIEAVIINNNPETVSTDFDTADRLYFEPLVPEDVLNILLKEKPEGVIVQFGGQTAINLASPLEKAGIKILGTSVDDIDRAEDRERFDQLLIELNIPKPMGKTAFSVEEAVEIADRIGFPVLVRPSYVLGGRAMEIVYNTHELLNYMETAVKITPEHPVLVDKYLFGKELEVDAICDGETVLIPGIMEHIERAGVHSGDSIAVYPTRSLNKEQKDKMISYTTKLALALNVKGLINIQYVMHDEEIYVLEVNPRSSRTIPYMSKITGIPMVNLATRIILGEKLKDMGYNNGLYPEVDFFGVKAPVFSFSKLSRVDISLGPEMKSTGEVLGIDKDYSVALYKALLASGCLFPREGAILATIADKDKEELLPLVKIFNELSGYEIYATTGTAAFLEKHNIKVTRVNKVGEGSPNIEELIREGKINVVLNTLTKGKAPQRDGFRIRRAAVEFGVPCFTSIDTAMAILEVLKNIKEGQDFDLSSLQYWAKSSSK